MTHRRGSGRKLSDWEIDEIELECRHTPMDVVAMRYGISEKTAQRYLRERREDKEDEQ
mgnify:CR=1 FL=1